MIRELLNRHRVTDVVHTAAIVAGDDDSGIDPETSIAVNAEAVWRLAADASAQPGFRRMVAVSSRAAYGSYDADLGLISEGEPYRPVGFYGATKAAADLILDQYRRRGVDVVSARVTGMFGPWAWWPTPINRIVAAATEGKPFRLAEAAAFKSEYIYVKDAARALLVLLDSARLEHGIYNVGGERHLALGDLAASVRELLPDADIDIGPGTLGDMSPRAQMSAERLRTDTGWSPRWAFDDALREYVWWRQMGDYGTEID